MEELKEQVISPIPRIGDPAPQFKAITTQGEIDFPSDYQGKWVIHLNRPTANW